MFGRRWQRPNRVRAMVAGGLVALAAGAIWALRALARRPRDEEAQEIAIARRVAGLGTARAELQVARVELEGVDGEWGVYLGEVEALCRRATTARIRVSVS